jgi:hypothetical protein
VSECAFCPHFAKLTAEHITSKWMGQIFPTRKKFKATDHLGAIREWASKGLDLKARVVCATCNNGWMSDIENKHAKPVMAPLMRGEVSATFGQNEARSLAIFAFKTAVVLDHDQAIMQHQEPFFSRRQRYAFRERLIIPETVRMWLTPYVPSKTRRRLDIRVTHSTHDLLPSYPMQIYSCSCGIGALAFQVIAYKQMFSVDFRPRSPDFDHLAIPFWPLLLPGYTWPGYRCLQSAEQFHAFARRWIDPEPVMPFS